MKEEWWVRLGRATCCLNPSNLSPPSRSATFPFSFSFILPPYLFLFHQPTSLSNWNSPIHPGSISFNDLLPFYDLTGKILFRKCYTCIHTHLCEPLHFFVMVWIRCSEGRGDVRPGPHYRGTPLGRKYTFFFHCFVCKYFSFGFWEKPVALKRINCFLLSYSLEANFTLTIA